MRSLLRGVGPGGVRAGLAIVLGVLVVLVLLSAVISYTLASFGREEAEREAGGEQYTVLVGPQGEDFPLVFGPGPSPDLAGAASAEDGPRRGIPGLSEMEVIGYLQYVPGTTDFRCPGGTPNTRVCTLASTEGPAVYEVTFHKDGSDVYALVATATDASEDEAAEVLGHVARYSIGHLGPLDAEAWVDRSISSGGQYLANGAEVRLYGTERTRTLEIVATASPEPVPELTDLIPEIPEPPSLEITGETTDLTP